MIKTRGELQHLSVPQLRRKAEALQLRTAQRENYRIYGHQQRDAASSPTSSYRRRLLRTVQLMKQSALGMEEPLLTLRPLIQGPITAATTADESPSSASYSPIIADTTPVSRPPHCKPQNVSLADPASSVQQPPLPDKGKQKMVKGEYTATVTLMHCCLSPSL